MADDAAAVCHLFMLALADAVKRTASTLGIGHGVAAARIVDAARAGLIDGYWRGYYANRLYRYRSAGKPILRREWAGAEIDWRADVLILANGEHRALVVLDRQQFETWLADQTNAHQVASRPEDDSAKTKGTQPEAVSAETQNSQPEAARTRGSPTLDRAKQAISELYPKGPPTQAELSNPLRTMMIARGWR